jgi:hypothetical protein
MSKGKENKIHHREDVNPDEGIKKYGDVEFADAINHKYPLDTAKHVRAAHRYISQKDNAAKYTADEVKVIKERIHNAAKKYGIGINSPCRLGSDIRPATSRMDSTPYK